MIPDPEFFAGFIGAPAGKVEEERDQKRDDNPLGLKRAEAQRSVIRASQDLLFCRTGKVGATARFGCRGTIPKAGSKIQRGPADTFQH